MLHKRIFTFIIVCVTFLPAFSSNEHNVEPDSGQDFSIYYLKTFNDFSLFDRASFLSLENIILARNLENKFLGDFGSDWRKAALTGIEYETVIEGDGNCSVKCEATNEALICSCDKSSSLVDGTDWHSNTSENVFLSEPSGKFMMNEANKIWVIKAPDNRIIDLEITRYDGLGQYYYMDYEVYDNRYGDQDRMPPHDTSPTVHRFISSGPYLYLETHAGWRYYDTFAAYKTGLLYYTKVDDQYDGTINVFSQLRGLRCYSVTYDGNLDVFSSDGNSKTRLTSHLSFMHHKLQWRTSVFQTIFHHENEKMLFKFSLGSKVLMLRECLDIEYPFWTVAPIGMCYNGGTWNGTHKQCDCEEGFSGSNCEKGPNIECENGGVWNGTNGSCMCPPGFMGAYCEEGCDPNAYGENCAEICSILSTECARAIFCRANVCTCAAGFYGQSCDSSCPKGRYGASCHQNCGKCKDNTICDRYTGKCYSGCAPGYYPPLCQKTYKVLKTPPEILETGYRHLKLRTVLWNQTGRGEPKFYEVQYKAENEESWSRLTPRKISNEAELIIENLLPGHYYSVRIILIDQDGGRCELNVPETKVMTKCAEPQQADYKLAAKDISKDKITVEWSYIFDTNADFCLVTLFELSLMSKNKQLSLITLKTDGTRTLYDMLPNTAYRIQLTGITKTGLRIPSPELTVHTLPADPDRVVDVQVVRPGSSRELQITWQPPRKSSGQEMKYRISYTCVTMLACNSADYESSAQEKLVETTSVLLQDLQPHAIYQIEITALTSDGVASEGYSINTTTEDTAPQVAPSAAANPILGVTNVSASITWLPPGDCALLNGYLYGYFYKLVDNATRQVIKENTVQENVQFVNFTDLEPNHCYDVEIAVVTSGGVDLSYKLVIPFCTSPAAPGPVQFLKVYKRSRKMVGLKWGRPHNTYGEIDSFLISYSEEGTDNAIKRTVKPQYCKAWRDLYCHTISHLSPAKKYSFTVQAHNDRVDADGEPSTVEAVTTEGVSTPPVNLKVVNATENTVTLEWQLPENINGFLRSFIIMTGQVDTKGVSDECCGSIPLADYRVTSEEPYYQYEINGLSPASTYSVTVAAKTLTLGEETHITAHTQPPKGLLAENAIEVVGTEKNSDNTVTVSLKIHPAKRLHGVKRTYFLLLLSNTTSTEHTVDDDDLRTLLEARFADKYHLISKYTQDELEENPLIQFNPKDLGFENVDIQSCRYALVLIQDYMSNTSADISVSGIQ